MTEDIDQSASRRVSGKRRWRHLVIYAGTVIVVLTLLACGGSLWLYGWIEASLPQLDGATRLVGLAAPVTVERDALGVPTIRAGDRVDSARALGFLHAQERFFQMDLLRRSAAGELAELFGKAALPTDTARRVHRFRARAREINQTLSPAERRLLDSYTSGVNAGLAALLKPPFEYLVLGEQPVRWRNEDTLLAIYAMYFDLQDEAGRHESDVGLMHDVLPPALFAFLTPPGTEWDAPLQGAAFAPAPVPPPEVFDLRGTDLATVTRPATQVLGAGAGEAVIGSNNWVLAGNRSKHGGALLAGDMHLRVAIPNIWYRASLVFADSHGEERRVTGVTLPGVPVIVAGSNGGIAWTFTNSYGDWSDLVIIEPAADEGAYRTPTGARTYIHHQELIRIKGGGTLELDVVETIWGPVIDQDHRGRQRALRWVAHEPAALDLGLLALETARGVEDALLVANRAGLPAQNILVAGRDGRIAWTIAGPVPRRFGHDGRLPRSWAEGGVGWRGWLAPVEYPRIVDPPDGRLWTANARTVGGAELVKLGDGGYAFGARARQIRDGLLVMEHADEAAMLALQLDDRALFLQRWRDFLLEVLDPVALADAPRRQELRQVVERWSGRAGVDSVGYRMVRAFRLLLAEQVFAPLVAACKQADVRFVYGVRIQQEGPLWQLVREQPEHLLNPRFDSWQAQFLAAVDAVLDHFAAASGDLLDHTWGEHNMIRFRHPMSRALPGAGRWLDMAAVPQPGDLDMPRVQTRLAGASQRMVVSPGHEQHGFFHMPGGQSGHPLSAHYDDGHKAWVTGEPAPFLPGLALHRLILQP